MGHIPLGQNTFSSTTLLRLANLELQTPLMAQILSTRGNYYLTYTDYPVVASGLYVIPSACVGGALENVQLIQAPTIVPVNQIEPSEQFSTISPTSTSYGFFAQGNFIQILPTPNIGVARLWYSQRPSDLILTTAACLITGINISSTVFTVSSIPSTIVIGSLVDLLGDQPPFNVVSQANPVVNIVGTDITFGAPVLGMNVGDWIAPTNQTPVPQIPVEFRVLLAQRVVCKVYELQGYLDKLTKAHEVLERYEMDTFKLITPRVKMQTRIINSVNGGFMSSNQNRMTNFPAR